MTKQFLNLLKQQQNAPGGHVPADLTQFADEISEFVGSPAKCEIIVGRLVDYGQEYRVVLTFDPLDYSQTLCRVYVPLQGANVTYHPTGGAIEHDVANLSAKLLDLLKLPALMDTLQYIKAKADQFRHDGRISEKK